MLRKARFAGSFYDSNPDKLKQDFDNWFQIAQVPAIKGKVFGVICPHAGYIYSGLCAAYSYKLLSKIKIKTAIVLHPSHRGSHFSYSVSPFSQYETPLGNLELDVEVAKKLTVRGSEPIDNMYHLNEHSMEVQLPFLAYINPKIKVVPVMFGSQNPTVSEALALSLADAINDETIIIASTDLSHYHTSIEAELMDRKLINGIRSGETGTMYNEIRHGFTEACGIAGIMTLMYLASPLDGSNFTELHYNHSGVTSCDYNQVVGYLSASLTQG